MSKKTVQELSQPIRELLQRLVRKKVKTKQEREELAEFLGIKTSSLSNMLYKGEGGLNLWIGTLIYLYQFDMEDVIHFFDNYHILSEKMEDLDPLDREWMALGRQLSDHDKKFVLGLVDMALGLHKSLYTDRTES